MLSMSIHECQEGMHYECIIGSLYEVREEGFCAGLAQWDLSASQKFRVTVQMVLTCSDRGNILC